MSGYHHLLITCILVSFWRFPRLWTSPCRSFQWSTSVISVHRDRENTGGINNCMSFYFCSLGSSHCACWFNIMAYQGFQEERLVCTEAERCVVIRLLSCHALTVTAPCRKRCFRSCTCHQYVSQDWLRVLLSRREEASEALSKWEPLSEWI